MTLNEAEFEEQGPGKTVMRLKKDKSKRMSTKTRGIIKTETGIIPDRAIRKGAPIGAEKNRHLQRQ